MSSYYQSSDFLDEIRKKSTDTLKVKGLLSRYKKRNATNTKETYKNELTKELIKTGEYVKLYEKFNNIPNNLQEDIFNAMLITLFSDDDLKILELYEYEEPSIALSQDKQ